MVLYFWVASLSCVNRLTKHVPYGRRGAVHSYVLGHAVLATPAATANDRPVAGRHTAARAQPAGRPFLGEQPVLHDAPQPTALVASLTRCNASAVPCNTTLYWTKTYQLATQPALYGSGFESCQYQHAIAVGTQVLRTPWTKCYAPRCIRTVVKCDAAYAGRPPVRGGGVHSGRSRRRRGGSGSPSPAS